MESLSNVKELRSIAGYATAAYAWPSGATTSSHIGKAYVSGTQTTVGLKRRTIMVDATDVNVSDYTTAELTTVMNRKAKDALANNNYVRLMDGQLVPQNLFKYGTDYTLGDVIELRSGSTKENARITEYIRAQDNTGFQAYPTLTVVS